VTVVVAHRTCPRDARENSLEGIVTAARLGAEVVELDARRSRNGTAVVIHDPWLGRIQHVPWLVRWSNDSQLRRLRVPTLTEALDTARSVGLRVAIDAKDAGVVEAVLQSVRRTGADEYVLFWSQHMSTARAFAQAVPDADVGLFRDTLDEAAHRQLLADAVATGARAVSAHQDAVTPGFIAAARERGLDVYVGYQTLDVQSARLPVAADAGLTGVVTDWPAEARTLLDRTSSP
jgi:myo-inositol-1(or 4)-monophosphatase/deoxyribonuclease-2